MKRHEPRADGGRRSGWAFAWLLLAGLVGSGLPVVLATPNRPPTFELPTGRSDAWMPRGGEQEWTCVASSADGRNLAAGVWDGRLHVSEDFGATWTPREEVRRWRALAFSADGRRLVAAVENGRIHVSDDGGTTWVARENPWRWSAVTSSADGRVLAATVAGGRIHVSTNAGVTWTPRAMTGDWRGIASSADGRNLVAAAYRGDILASTNSGETWQPVGSPGAWTALAASADGRFVAAAESRGYVQVSKDGGATWLMTDSNPSVLSGRTRAWQALVCSADAGILVGVDAKIADERDDAAGYVIASANQGETWDWLSRQRRWSAIAASADGHRLVAAARGGQLYTLGRTTSRHTVLTTTQSGPVSLPRFATGVAAGPAGEFSRSVRFQVTADAPDLFAVPPQLQADGTLTFATGSRPGSTTVTVAAWDVIGAAGDRTAVSAPQTFTLSVEGQSFKATPWTGDASTGISRSSTLWAWRMGLPAPEEAVINGVPVRFPPGPAYTSPGQFALEGETEGHPYFMSQPLGFEGRGSKLLANSYTDRGNPAVIRLEGLVAGRPYTLHVYGVGVPYPGGLRCTWSAEGEAVDIDEEVFGVHHGIRVSHDFTPRTDHYEITVMPRGVAPWAFSGLALNAVPARAALEPLAGSGLSRGGVFDFGRVPLGLPLRLGFTLRNEGIVPLKDLKFTVEGANADEFVVIPPTEGLVPGESRSAFSLVFRPTGPGPRKAVLRLASNEPEPFTLHLAGTGLPEAEIPLRDLPDRTIDEDQTTGPIGFTVDEPSPGRESALAGTSSDPALVPPTGIVFEGTGPHRRVVVRPAAARSGTAVVRVLASDGVHSSSHRFRLTVRPVNDPPRFVLPQGLVTPAGTDWAPRGSPRRWQALAASHDGRRLVAAAQGSRI